MTHLNLSRLGQSILFASLMLASLASKGQPIQITTVPPSSEGGPGRMDRIAGVVNAKCEDCSIVIFALGDVWYVQPWANAPFTSFSASDGKWSTDTHLGSEYAALLVRRTYKPPSRTATLPAVAGDVIALIRVRGRQTSALPQSSAPFQDANTLRFSGRNWVVKTSQEPVGPGPNVFSSRNAWVDEDGRLHLKISNQGGRWTCAEVICQRKHLGYGLYKFTVADTSTLPPNAVLGLFTWDPKAGERHNREMDIEVSRWNDPGNANGQYVIQPFSRPENISRYSIPRGAATHQFIWSRGVVSFQSAHLQGSSARKIHEHTFRAGVPVPGGEQIRINFYLAGGLPQTKGADLEVVVDKFEFHPQGGPA